MSDATNSTGQPPKPPAAPFPLGNPGSTLVVTAGTETDKGIGHFYMQSGEAVKEDKKSKIRRRIGVGFAIGLAVGVVIGLSIGTPIGMKIADKSSTYRSR